MKKGKFLFLLMLLLIVVTGYPDEEMPYYWTEGKKVYLAKSNNLVVIKIIRKLSKIEKYLKAKNIKCERKYKFAIIDKKILKENELINNKSDYIIYPLYQYKNEPVVITNEIMIKFKKGLSENTIFNILKKYPVIVQEINKYEDSIYLLKVNNKEDILKIANRLYQNRNVIFASPNFIEKLKYYSVPNDPYFQNQWYLNRINLDAWEITDWGKNEIKVAVNDSGIDLNHSDLKDILLLGRDTYDNDNDPSPDNSYSKDYHGTACAGIIGAIANNNIGISGIAGGFYPNYGVKIIPVKISGQNGYSSIYSVGNSFYWCADNNVDVISNSWSLNLPSDFVHQAVIYASNNGRNGKGCIIMCSSGNDDENVISEPAKYKECIAVGALNKDDKRFSSSDWGSNYGKELNIMGYGNDIFTTDISGNEGKTNSDYNSSFAGTSAACPMVAGVAALILMENPNLTKDQVEDILYKSADDIKNTGWDKYTGYGRVNAFNALLGFGTTYKVAGVPKLKVGTTYKIKNIVPEYCGDITVTKDRIFPDFNNYFWFDGRTNNLKRLSYGKYYLYLGKKMKGKFFILPDDKKPIINDIYRISNNKISYYVIDWNSSNKSNNGVFNSIWFLDENDNIITELYRMKPEFRMPKTITIPQDVIDYGLNKAKIMIFSVDPAGNYTSKKRKISDLKYYNCYIANGSHEYYMWFNCRHEKCYVNRMEVRANIVFPNTYSDIPNITNLRTNGFSPASSNNCTTYAEVLPDSFKTAGNGYAGCTVRTWVYWISKGSSGTVNKWYPCSPYQVNFDYKIEDNENGDRINPFNYEYGGDNSLHVKRSKRKKRRYTYYIYPKDRSYQIYKWIRIRTGKNKRSKDAGTYIDYKHNRLVVKIELNGKWYSKAYFNYVYFALGRKERIVGPPEGSIDDLVFNTIEPDYICNNVDNIEVNYSISGNQIDYLCSMNVYSEDDQLVKKLINNKKAEGNYVRKWDFTTDNSLFDADGDGKTDPGKYLIKFEIKTVDGSKILDSKSQEIKITKGDYYYTENETIDDGIRMDIGGAYSYGSVDQVDSPFILKLSDGTYRMYYEAGHDGIWNGVEYKGWWRRIMTAHSTDGVNWVKDGEISGFQGGYPDYQCPSVMLLSDGKIRVYYSVWAKLISGSNKISAWTLSAISDDGIHFTVENGKRLDYGGEYDTDRANRAKIYFDGTDYTMYYSGGIEDSSSYYILQANSSNGLDFTKTNIPLVTPGCYYDSSAVYNSAISNDNTLYYTGTRPGKECICTAKKIDSNYEKNKTINFVDSVGNDLFSVGLRGYTPYLIDIEGKEILYFAGFDGSHKKIYSRGFDATTKTILLSSIDEKKSLIEDNNSLEKINNETTSLENYSTFYYDYPDVNVSINEENPESKMMSKNEIKKYSGIINVNVRGNGKRSDIKKVKLYVDEELISEIVFNELTADIDTDNYSNGLHKVIGCAVDNDDFEGRKIVLCEFEGKNDDGGGGFIIPPVYDDDWTLTELTGFNKPTSIAVGNFENRCSMLIADRNAGDITGNDSVKVFDIKGNLIKEIKDLHKPEKICLSNSGDLYLLTNNRDGIYKYDGEKFELFLNIKNIDDIKWNGLRDKLEILKANGIIEYNENGEKENELTFTNDLNSFDFEGEKIIGNLIGTGEFVKVTNDCVICDYKKEMTDFVIKNNIIYGLEKYTDNLVKYNMKEKTISNNLNNPTQVVVFNYNEEKIIGVVERNSNRILFFRDNKEIENEEENEIKKVVTYPNPAGKNLPVKFMVEAKKGGKIELEIYTISGKMVYKIEENVSKGENILKWYKKNKSGMNVSSGIYYWALKFNGKAEKRGKFAIKK